MISVDYATDILWLWDTKHDTAEIAKRLNWRESEVAKILWREREERRAKRGNAA
jgi:hypothetical protein